MVFVEIRDRPRRDAGRHGRFRNRRRDAQDQPGIERTRNQRTRSETFGLSVKPDRRIGRRLTRESRNGIGGGVLHVLVDRGRADVESAAENEGKAQDIVHLIGEVGAAGADHRIGPHLARLVRHDFGVRIGERHHQRLVRHLRDHLRLQHAAGRNPEKHVRARDHIGQRALVGCLRISRLPSVHQPFATLVDKAVDIADPDVLALRAHRHQKIEARDGGRPCPGSDDLDVRKRLAVQEQSVGDGGCDDDGGAVLIVMEHRNLHPGLQLLLDLEALRALDVFKVDAAESRLQRRDRLDHALDGVGCYLDIEHVDAGELLEQDRLAFHHRLGCERADIAETEHGRAVRHHRDQIGSPGERRRFRWISDDLFAGRGHARRIGQREIALVGERLGGLDFELAGTRVAVEGQRGGAEILGIRHDERSRGSDQFIGGTDLTTARHRPPVLNKNVKSKASPAI